MPPDQARWQADVRLELYPAALVKELQYCTQRGRHESKLWGKKNTNGRDRLDVGLDAPRGEKCVRK